MKNKIKHLVPFCWNTMAIGMDRGTGLFIFIAFEWCFALIFSDVR